MSNLHIHASCPCPCLWPVAMSTSVTISVSMSMSISMVMSVAMYCNVRASDHVSVRISGCVRVHGGVRICICVRVHVHVHVCVFIWKNLIFCHSPRSKLNDALCVNKYKQVLRFHRDQNWFSSWFRFSFLYNSIAERLGKKTILFFIPVIMLTYCSLELGTKSAKALAF